MISKKWCMIFSVLMIFTFVYPYPVFSGAPLTLEESIAIALKNSNILNMAKEGTKGAAAQKKEAITEFLPKFNTSYSYTMLSEAPYSRFSGIPPGPLYGMNGMEIPVGTKDNYNWAIEVKQPLFAGGGILANYEASSIGENVARMEEASKYQDVVQEVSIAYFNVLRAQKIQEVARQSVEMLKAHRDVAENYFKVGMIPKNDLLYAEVELANGNVTQVKAQNAVELAKANLNTVLKRDISAPVEIVDILNYQPFKKSFDECVNIAIQVMPELKISSLKAQQAGKLVQAEQSYYLPSLNMVGNYTRFGDDLSVSGSDYKDMESWYVMAVASWNFWEWGKTKFRVDASKSRENQAIEWSKELNDQIILKIKNAYLILQDTENQIIVSQKLIEQAEENFRIAEERYKVGIATSTEVLDAQTILTEAKAKYTNALGDYNVNSAKLQRAMGTIWGADEGYKMAEGNKVDEGSKAAEGSKIDEGNKTVEGDKKAEGNNADESDKSDEGNIKSSDNVSPEGNQTDNSNAPVAAAAVTEKSAPVAPVTENSASVSNEQNATKSIPEEDVRILVNKWLAGWQSGDMETYGGCYASDFKSQGKNLKAWVSYKTKVHQKNKNVSIRIEDLKISADANASTATAIFNQYYSSPIHKDTVKKTLMLRKVNGEWKIYKETSAPLK